MTAEPSPEPRVVSVAQTPIELCQFLKFGGLAGTGGQAKQAISDGQVLLNGAVEVRRGKKLAVGDQVTFAGRTIVVGR